MAELIAGGGGIFDVVADGELLKVTQEIAQEIASNAPLATRAVKRMLRPARSTAPAARSSSGQPCARSPEAHTSSSSAIPWKWSSRASTAFTGSTRFSGRQIPCRPTNPKPLHPHISARTLGGPGECESMLSRSCSVSGSA